MQRQRSGEVAENILYVMEIEVLKEENLMVCTIKRAVFRPMNAAFAKRIAGPGESMNAGCSVCEISVMALGFTSSLFSVRRS